MEDQEKFFEWLASHKPGKGNRSSQELSLAEQASYASRPEVVGNLYYTLPVNLLKAILARSDPNSDLSAAMHTEMKLTTQRGDHSDHVGYWRGSNVLYSGFRLRSVRLLSEHKTLQQWPDLKTRGIKRVYLIEHADARVSRDLKSYLGWLLTEKLFLQEHDELLTRHVNAIRRWGIEHGAHMPVAETIYSDESSNPVNDPALMEYESEKQAFLFRWRLAGLAGPYLPLPLDTNVDPEVSRNHSRSMTRIGTFLFVPDTVAIPSRDELRKLLNDARSDLPKEEHLSEWQTIIRSENSARNQLQRYRRIFELQHYSAPLFQRHRTRLKGRVGDLEVAFALWLKVSTETVHQDLIIIRRRLGKDWVDRASPV